MKGSTKFWRKKFSEMREKNSDLRKEIENLKEENIQKEYRKNSLIVEVDIKFEFELTGGEVLTSEFDDIISSNEIYIMTDFYSIPGRVAGWKEIGEECIIKKKR